jgi:hypothetical protein
MWGTSKCIYSKKIVTFDLLLSEACALSKLVVTEFYVIK